MNFKPVKGYEGLYEVSDTGVVRSLDRFVDQVSPNGEITPHFYKGRVLKPRVGKAGYLYLHLSKNGEQKTKKVHRLVAENWIPNPEGKPEVNHLKSKLDNGIHDLEWATTKENAIHAIKTGRKVNRSGKDAHNYRGDVAVVNKQGEIIDILTGDKDITAKGYTSCGVSAVLTGRQKTHRNCYFKLLKDIK